MNPDLPLYKCWHAASVPGAAREWEWRGGECSKWVGERSVDWLLINASIAGRFDGLI